MKSKLIGYAVDYSDDQNIGGMGDDVDTLDEAQKQAQELQARQGVTEVTIYAIYERAPFRDYKTVYNWTV